MKYTGNKNGIDRRMRSFLFPVFYCLFFLPFLASAQGNVKPKPQTTPQNTPQSSVKVGGKKIEILNAGVLKSAVDIADGAKRLIGDVRFKHEDVLMFCDSAYFYSNNSLDAFGHVHIQQNDSIHLYGDFLTYSGNTKKAVLTKNVVANKTDMQLTTEVLNYDVATSIGYYTVPGKIVSKENVLTSEQGYFFGKSNDLTFKKNVVLTNPDFVINCDTMRYNTSSKITYFTGPTTIKGKENLIYCEDGWYDTDKDLSRFSKNAYILTQEQKMWGDSLYYDRVKGIGRAVHNVQIVDTAQKLNIAGDLALHYEFKDLSVITGHALLTQMFDNDTLYMHADTLKALGESTKEQIDPAQRTQVTKTKNGESKTTIRDSTKTGDEQRLFAYHKVKFYKRDMQGKCDSLMYTTVDSTMRMYGNPTLWSSENQLTADSISVVTGKKSLLFMELKGTGFIVSSEDSTRYNQIRGKYMKGFFNDNKLFRVNVEVNRQTIYFAKEKEEIKAVNRADCSDLHIFLKENEIDRIVFITKPDATLYPLDKIDTKELRLKDFKWRINERPLTFKDIFNW